MEMSKDKKEFLNEITVTQSRVLGEIAWQLHQLNKNIEKMSNSMPQ